MMRCGWCAAIVRQLGPMPRASGRVASWEQRRCVFGYAETGRFACRQVGLTGTMWHGGRWLGESVGTERVLAWGLWVGVIGEGGTKGAGGVIGSGKEDFALGPTVSF